MFGMTLVVAYMLHNASEKTDKDISWKELKRAVKEVDPGEKL